MTFVRWLQARLARPIRVAGPGPYGWVVASIFLLIGSPFLVEKYLVLTLQGELQESALHCAAQLSQRLDTEKKGFYRTALAASADRSHFDALSKAWLSGASDVRAVKLLSPDGQILHSVTRAEAKAGIEKDVFNAVETLNRIAMAQAVELQEPIFTGLQQMRDESLVDLIVPTGTASTLFYVVTLDANQWLSQLAETCDHAVGIEIVPFRTDLAAEQGRYYQNSSAWEGLWTLKFQSKTPLFELLQILRPLFFVFTWLIAGMFFLYWRNFRLRQKAEMELRTKSQMLERQNRLSLLGEMSAQLAHEINQPLASIANYAVAGKLQLQATQPNDDLAALFQEILEQSQRAAQVLIAVRAILQPNPLDLSNIHIDELIHKLEPSLRFLCRPNQVVLVVSSTKSLPARINTILFEQVIFNMVKNSIQALTESDRPDKRISISCSENKGKIMIEIEDNGPGIEDDHAAQIFESFFTTKADGLGIGLSLCRSVIERFNGKLTLKSNSHRGVCFEIAMPISHA